MQEKSLEFERQLQALIAAGASLEDRKKLLKQMASHTLEGIILTLKAHVHFLRWAAVGERMIAQGRGMDWAAAVQDPSALAAKGMLVRPSSCHPEHLELKLAASMTVKSLCRYPSAPVLHLLNSSCCVAQCANLQAGMKVA